MKKKSDTMFSSKSQSERGIMSAALGMISFVSLVAAVLTAFSNRGAATLRLGSVGLLAVLIAFGGLWVGVMSVMEKDRYPLFPWLGVICNALAIVSWIIIIYVGGS